MKGAELIYLIQFQLNAYLFFLNKKFKDYKLFLEEFVCKTKETTNI